MFMNFAYFSSRTSVPGPISNKGFSGPSNAGCLLARASSDCPCQGCARSCVNAPHTALRDRGWEDISTDPGLCAASPRGSALAAAAPRMPPPDAACAARRSDEPANNCLISSTISASPALFAYSKAVLPNRMHIRFDEHLVLKLFPVGNLAHSFCLPSGDMVIRGTCLVSQSMHSFNTRHDSGLLGSIEVICFAQICATP